MKRLFVLLFGALALLINACEKHPASRLPGEHAMQFEKHLGGHGHGDHAADSHAAKPAVEPAPAAKPPAEAKPGEAPKFFPEKK